MARKLLESLPEKGNEPVLEFYDDFFEQIPVPKKFGTFRVLFSRDNHAHHDSEEESIDVDLKFSCEKDSLNASFTLNKEDATMEKKIHDVADGEFFRNFLQEVRDGVSDPYASATMQEAINKVRKIVIDTAAKDYGLFLEDFSLNGIGAIMCDEYLISYFGRLIVTDNNDSVILRAVTSPSAIREVSRSNGSASLSFLWNGDVIKGTIDDVTNNVNDIELIVDNWRVDKPDMDSWKDLPSLESEEVEEEDFVNSCMSILKEKKEVAEKKLIYSAYDDFDLF